MNACPIHAHPNIQYMQELKNMLSSSGTKACIHTQAHRPPFPIQTFNVFWRAVKRQLRGADMFAGKLKSSPRGYVDRRRWQETQQQVYRAIADAT